MNVRDIGGSPQFPRLPFQQSRRTAGPAPDEKPEAAPSVPDSGAATLLSSEEKTYFESVFPEAAQDVRAFRAYTGRGTRPHAPTGTHVDRKA